MATGPNGRNHHRPFPVPKYEYEKQRTSAAKEVIAKALSAQMPVLSATPADVCNAKTLSAQMPVLSATPADVCIVDDGSYYARFGEAAPQRLGEHAGVQLGVRRMQGGASEGE